MEYNEDDFEWDASKFDGNIKKHQLSFDEARTIWLRHEDLLIREDTRNYSEVRYVAFGLLADSTLLAVVFIFRGPRIRIISARKANRRERNRYEQEIRKAR